MTPPRRVPAGVPDRRVLGAAARGPLTRGIRSVYKGDSRSDRGRGAAPPSRDGAVVVSGPARDAAPPRRRGVPWRLPQPGVAEARERPSASPDFQVAGCRVASGSAIGPGTHPSPQQVPCPAKLPWSAGAVEARAVSSLLPYAGNARTHPPEQVAQIAASILEFGFNVPVLVDEAGVLVAGHGRLLAAKNAGPGHGAGDPARAPERGAGACLPAGGQPDRAQRRLGRGPARRRAARLARRRVRPRPGRLRSGRSSTGCWSTRRTMAVSLQQATPTRRRRSRPRIPSPGPATCGCSGRTGCSAAMRPRRRTWPGCWTAPRRT